MQESLHLLQRGWALILLLIATTAFAQTSAPPVNPARVTFIDGAQRGLVTVNISEGGASAGAWVAVQNALTGDVAYGRADNNGQLSLDLRGMAGDPYIVTAAPFISDSVRRQNALPDGEQYRVQQRISSAGDSPVRFTHSGLLSFGSSIWQARGAIENVQLAPGETTYLSLDMRLAAPVNVGDNGLTPGADVALVRLTDDEGRMLSNVSDAPANWTHTITPTGIPLLMENEQPVMLASTSTDRLQIDEAGNVDFRLLLPLTIPADTAPGLYAITFTGWAQAGDSAPFDWYDNRFFGADGSGEAGTSTTRLPVVLRVGDMPPPQMALTLLNTSPDSNDYAVLSAGGDTGGTIVQPGTYDLLPVLHAPDVALNLTDSWLQLTVNAPDNTTMTGGQIAVSGIKQQNGQSVLELATMNTLDLSQYGTYRVTVQGQTADFYGNMYRLEQAYTVTVAERLRLLPAMMSGAPLIVGEPVPLTVRTAPPFPAEITAEVTARQSNGAKQTRSFSAVADSNGYAGLMTFTPDTFGAYSLRLSARYVDDAGRLWADDLLSSGVIVDTGSSAAHGVRGIAGYERDQPAWYNTAIYPADAAISEPAIHFPYFSGDLAFIPAENGVIVPAVSDADNAGYALTTITQPGGTVQQLAYSGADVAGSNALNPDLNAGDVLLNFAGIISPDGSSAYASGTVITDAAPRVTPPLQTDIVRDSARGYRALWLPRDGVPGQVYRRGQAINIAGQFLPALPLTIHVTHIAPDNSVQEYSANANPFGGLYDVQTGLILQAGIHEFRLRLGYDGYTSLEPYSGTVEGGIYGAGDVFSVYVASNDMPLTTDRDSIETINPLAQQFLSVTVPEGWDDVRGHVTVWSDAGYLLEQSPLTITGSSATYRYLPQALDNHITAFDPAAADGVRVTLALEGTVPENGERVLRTRTFTLQGERLVTAGNE